MHILPSYNLTPSDKRIVDVAPSKHSCAATGVSDVLLFPFNKPTMIVPSGASSSSSTTSCGKKQKKKPRIRQSSDDEAEVMIVPGV